MKLLESILAVLVFIAGQINQGLARRSSVEHQETVDRIEKNPGEAMRDHFNRKK